jgi:dihydrofolate reductase
MWDRSETMPTTHPEIVLILARADNGVIGRDGSLPWHLPADLRRFKMLTQGRPMIMGRKTFDSLPGLLNGRRHIVLTRDTEWRDDGAEVAHDLDAAIRLANAPVISVIGGAEIYRLFLPVADRIELTEVHIDAEGDTVIDRPDPAAWQEAGRDDHPAENSRPAYSFVTLRRA